MTRHTDQRLARRATRGDGRAFEAIYRRYGQDLYRFCLAMVSNPQDAQDTLQNAMLKALRALPGEERRIELKPWLYRVVRNEAVETLRRRRDSAELAPEQTVDSREIFDTAEQRQRLRELLADLSELPERQRSALVMRELSGLGFEQIARAFDTSAAVARQTVYEARLSLRQMEAGREMRCEGAMRELSDADGRVTRRRELRAHLRNCPSCRAFREEIAERRGEFAALAPLPLAASAALLHGLLGGQASSAAGTGAAGVGGAVGSGAGSAVATPAIVKSVAVIAAAAAVGATAADRSGLIDLHFPADGQRAQSSRSGSGEPVGPQATHGAGAGAAAKPGAPVEADAGKGRRTPSGKSANRSSAATAGAGTGPRDETDTPGAGAADRPAATRSGNAAPGHSSGSHDGGRGHSAPNQKGPPEGLPEAANQGQQVSTAHKAPQANPSPGPGSGAAIPPPGPPASGQGGGAPPVDSAPPPNDDPLAGPPPGQGGPP